MSTLRSKTVKYPGVHGLNTLDATLSDEEKRFGDIILNGIVGSDGRLASRKDFVNQTTGFSGTLKSVYSWRQSTGAEVIMSAATDGKIYSGVGTLTQRWASSGVLANVQFATLGQYLFMAQAGSELKSFDNGYSNATLVGAASNWTTPNVVIAAYGRVWVADDAAGNNRHTIWWSALLNGLAWNSGDAGNISLAEAWPKGQDSIIALAAAFGRLVVFGRKSILLYTLPADNNPASMTLTDVIEDMGCVARDSVCVTDTGILFLSDNGIYRIDKLGQTTSLLTPKQVSMLYNDEVLAQIAVETPTSIRGGFYPTEGVYLLSFPTSNVTFAVHTKKIVPDFDVPVGAIWNNVGRPFYGFAFDKDRNFYSAGVNGIHKYTGYTPDGASNAYTFTWGGQWMPIEDDSRLKHFKSATAIIEAASGQTGSFTYKLGYAEGTTFSNAITCDAVEFAENPGVGSITIPLGGSSTVIKPGLSFSINGNAVTLHQLRLYANPGKVVLR